MLNKLELSSLYSVYLYLPQIYILIMSILATLIIGALAGWLGSEFYKGSGLGLIGNIVIGIIGSIVGSSLLGYLGVSLGSGWISDVLTGAIGAVVILFLFNLVFKK